MVKYCAFLRGVNVKGTAMKMAEVKLLFENAGLQNVKTVLASGNVIFESEKPDAELKELLEKKLTEHFNYEAVLFIKNEKEVKEIFESNPFPKSENFHLYVFITLPESENELLKMYENCENTELEDAKILKNTLYWKVQKGNTLDSEFGKILGKKAWKDKCTSRNMNTFEKIIKQF